MPLQNRVAPDGSLHQDPSRGLFTGNRGVIHDPDGRRPSGRRWTTPAWICCTLRLGNRKRNVWGRNGPRGNAGWSELFFLDEVTALSAGHRPCFFCRRGDARAFQAAWVAAGLGDGTAGNMNAVLHRERWPSRKTEAQTLSMSELTGLPDGAIIQSGTAFHAIRDGAALPWGFSGYGRPVPLSDFSRATARLVTPASVIRTLREGFRPAWHGSAADGA